MVCRMCGYSLWGLAARVCPECGATFRPREFVFVPNKVQFCCPHCRQAYYGTSPEGHLEPSAFTCAGCGSVVDMDEMIVLPAAGVDEAQTRPALMPWLKRAERGRMRAWLATIRLAMSHPTRLMRDTPPGSSSLAALWFAWLSQIIYSLSFSIFLPIALVYYLIWERGNPWLRGVAAGVGILYLGVAAATAGGLLLWSLVTHGMLWLTGGSQHGLRRTIQAVCYSSAATVFLAVPCLGAYLYSIGLLWWVVSAIYMVREGQGVHGGRAMLAVLTLPGLLLGFLLFIQSMQR